MKTEAENINFEMKTSVISEDRPLERYLAGAEAQWPG